MSRTSSIPLFVNFRYFTLQRLIKHHIPTNGLRNGSPSLFVCYTYSKYTSNFIPGRPLAQLEAQRKAMSLQRGVSERTGSWSSMKQNVHSVFGLEVRVGSVGSPRCLEYVLSIIRTTSTSVNIISVRICVTA